MTSDFHFHRIQDIILIWLFLFFMPSQIKGQSTISGIISDQNQSPIDYANIILKSGDKILQFSSSSKDGKWSLDLNDENDSLYLLITHLSYEDSKVPVIAGKEYYEVTLKDRSEKLPVVSIKAPPIEKRGDTLIFNIQSYKEDGDQTVEDVLARLPGIAIADNGEISYKGLPINKFYIEGLDLLEGRYKIATRNLGLEIILDVQVIERHQPIRALDSIFRPENAAINLKLKRNVAVTGSANAEFILPLAGLISTNWFGFTKNFQLNLSGSYNDMGRSISSDFTSFYGRKDISQNELISFRETNSPALKFNDELLEFNNEGTIGLNYLQKLGKITQIKAQGFLTLDKTSQFRTQQSLFQGINSTSELNEDFQINTAPLELETNLLLEHNAPRLYVRINTEFSGTSNDLGSLALINNQSSEEFLFRQKQSITSDGEYIFSKGKRAIAIKSKFSYSNKDYDFTIDSTYILLPSVEEKFYFDIDQRANLETYNFQLHSNYYYNIKSVSSTLELQPEWSRTNVESLTLSTDTLVSPLFTNQATTNTFAFNINQSWNYEFKKSSLSLKVPASLSYLDITQAQEEMSSTILFSVFKPRLSYSYDINQNQAIGIFSAYTREVVTQPSIYYDGYIINENRRIINNSFFPNRVRSQSVGAFWNGGNAFQKVFFRNFITFSRRQSTLLDNYSFNQFGTVQGVRNINNKSQNNAVLNKYEFRNFINSYAA